MRGTDLAARPPYRSLQQYFAKTAQQHLRDLFVADPDRGGRRTVGLRLYKNAATVT